ncbi:hypothetical protein ZIOFF_013229 [Zingiber officinale]|uniref:Uncharacterized protein n=1 Tax=Zingiber officinale TaxID=94328 RepID=A0A8J5HBD7_ZINOF|nr:hypothetical protein ZIOFF_013229 [Zingiber officinale]
MVERSPATNEVICYKLHRFFSQRTRAAFSSKPSEATAASSRRWDRVCHSQIKADEDSKTIQINVGFLTETFPWKQLKGVPDC